MFVSLKDVFYMHLYNCQHSFVTVSMKKQYQPNFKTPPADYSKEELNKLTHGLVGPLAAELSDVSKPEIIWEAEQIAKSYGIYLEWNRAKTGREKDWVYMVRISNPGGGPISRNQWLLFDGLSEQYAKAPDGRASLRLTTRQNIQFHWVRKEGVKPVVKALAEAGLRSLNGCGDNMRNVTACPLSAGSVYFDAHAWAKKTAEFFELPLSPYIQIFGIDPNYIRKADARYAYKPNLLNRKFKISFAGVHPDPKTGELRNENCMEVLANDMGIVPVIKDNRVESFQIYIGGSQGERNGVPSMASLALPVCRARESNLLQAMEAAVKVHEKWGDRKNRHWARVKYLIYTKGSVWYRERMQELVSFKLEEPEPAYDTANRELHLGWQKLPGGDWAYGLFIENGRVKDGGANGPIKTMLRTLIQEFPIHYKITANQDLLFCGIKEKMKQAFMARLEDFEAGKRNGKKFSELRLRSGACVGRDTCKMTYTDSERFEPLLIDELEAKGWGDMAESIGVTGCEAQCYRPATKSIGLVGSGRDRYRFKFFGDRNARHQGAPLVAPDQKIYLASVPRERVGQVIDILFKIYRAECKGGEDLGRFHRRLGASGILERLHRFNEIADLLEKPFHSDWVLEPEKLKEMG